jgi:anhydro-N-acetylmuramic acid kinase
MSNFETGLGIMSGTSLDGLDVALVKFEDKGKDDYDFQIIRAKTYDYPGKIRDLLISGPNLSGLELKKAELTYSKFIGEIVNEFCKDIETPDFVACHGHTIFHVPQEELTYQMLSGSTLAVITGLTTVCDFRSGDLAYGGQGAPLVPIGDELLFREYAACLNLGGFANISYSLPGKRIAFDICPVNIVLNELAMKLGHSFDKDGKIARSNQVDKVLLKKLNTISFYSQSGPKSLGREWVQAEITPLLSGTTEMLIATFTEHAAYQIGKIIKDRVAQGKILCTGGGTHNNFLLERIALHAEREIEPPSSEWIDFKEALIFAFLGKLRLDSKPNILGSVTGADRNSCGGAVYLP